MYRTASYRAMSSEYLSDKISVLKLSEAGFSYTGQGSVIKCEGCLRTICLMQLKNDDRILDPKDAMFHGCNCKFVICETSASSCLTHAEAVADKSCIKFSIHKGAHSEDINSQENSDCSDDSFSRDSENEETMASANYQEDLEAYRRQVDLSTFEPNKDIRDSFHVVTNVPDCMNALQSFKKPANPEDVDRCDNLLRSSHHEAFSLNTSDPHRETSNENLPEDDGLVRRRRTQPVLVGRPLHVLSGVADTEDLVDPRTVLVQTRNALQSAITLRLCESPHDQVMTNSAELNSPHTDSVSAFHTARISTKRAKKVVHATQDVIHRQNPMPSSASSVQLDFRLTSNRERSFRNGPQHLQAFAHFLYARGFFYTGKENIVRCWRCQYGCWIGRRVSSQHLDHECHSGVFSKFIHWFTRH